MKFYTIVLLRDPGLMSLRFLRGFPGIPLDVDFQITTICKGCVASIKTACRKPTKPIARARCLNLFHDYVSYKRCISIFAKKFISVIRFQILKDLRLLTSRFTAGETINYLMRCSHFCTSEIYHSCNSEIHHSCNSEIYH